MVIALAVAALLVWRMHHVVSNYPQEVAYALTEIEPSGNPEGARETAPSFSNERAGATNAGPSHQENYESQGYQSMTAVAYGAIAEPAPFIPAGEDRAVVILLSPEEQTALARLTKQDPGAWLHAHVRSLVTALVETERETPS